MSLTNLTFTSYMHRTNGVSSYRIDHYVEDALEATILEQTYWVDPNQGVLDPTNWYTCSHSWAPGTVVLEAGKVNQIRIYGWVHNRRPVATELTSAATTTRRASDRRQTVP